MGKKYDFDYIVIGSGPAGATTALALTKAKKQVAIVEGESFGGSAVNSRDVPYGISLDFAHTFFKLSHSPETSTEDEHFNFPTIVSHSEGIASIISDEFRKTFEDAGIACIEGCANFIDNNTIVVGSTQYTASNFILASGSHLKTNEISGLDTVNYLTPATAIKSRRLPKAALIVGGGASGCEIASYFAELGAKVLIIERASHLLPSEDKEVGQTIQEYFENELGIMVLTSSKVVALEQDNVSKRVVFNADGREKVVRVDCIVLATGSQPTVDYGLENAGVKYKNSGVIVDKGFQTSAKNIYAIGDCVSTKNSSTELAEYEGNLLASNLLRHTKNPFSFVGFARVVNTNPEVAVIGANEYDLLKQDKKCKKSLVELKDIFAGKIHQPTYGFVKLLADSSNHIIGATIVAPGASALAGEIALAIRNRLTASELKIIPHVASSFGAAIKTAAENLTKTA